jgi:hypothetical protein
MPRCIIEVIAAFTATGMTSIVDTSSLYLLELGSRRWCPHSRGLAIMSAAGITD